MQSASRLLLTLCLVLALLGIAVQLRLEGPAERGEAEGNLLQLGWKLLHALEDDGRQEREVAVYSERLRVKDSIIQELIKRRLSLLEAAAQFQDVDERLPVRLIIDPFAVGSAKEENYCRKVIGWVQVELRVNPNSRAPGLVEQLEHDLQDRLSK